MLLFVAIVGILFAWYVDRTNSDNDISGVWYYPSEEINLSGYWETLTIRADGTFTKHEQYRFGSETYEGEYWRSQNGVVTFHASKKRIGSNLSESVVVDAEFQCRCAIDTNNNLIIVDLHPETPHSGNRIRVISSEDCFLKWYCYTSVSHEEQSEAMLEMFREIANPSE